MYGEEVVWQGWSTRQAGMSKGKLDLILNINVLESSPSASPFPYLLRKPLRVVSSNTRDFYVFRYSPPVHFLVQVVLSRPVEALTPGPVGSRKGKPGMMNSGLEATVGDQGMMGDDVELGGYWRRGLPGLG